jgi:DUF917 family protein
MKKRMVVLFGALLSFAVMACSPASGNGAVQQAGQPKLHELTLQELDDLLRGSCIQATRGCPSDIYIKRVHEAVEKGVKFTMVSPSDMPSDWTTVSTAGVGGGGAWDYVIERTKKQELPIVQNTQLKSIELLAQHLGTKFSAVVRVEGAGATLSALMAAADLGVPVVDACLSQRARPEIQQQISWLNGIPATPAAMVTRFGDEVVIKRAADDYRAEDIARAMAVASGGGASIAMNPMTADEVRRGTVPNALSDAIKVGRAVREAREQGRDPIAALIEVTGGYKLFQGVVSKAESKGDRGFSWTDAELTGVGPYKGHKYRIYVKNENIVSWLDGKVDVASPDYIYNLDPKTGEAMTGGGLGGYEVGAEVAMVGVPAPSQWTTEAGIDVIGPRHFGFDFDYTPIAELQKKRAVRFGGQ